MGGLIAFISWLAGSRVVEFTASKVLRIAIITAILIPALWNLYIYFLTETMNWGLNKLASVGGGDFNATLQFFGIGAWLADCFMIPQCLSVIVSVITIKIAFRIIGSLTFVKVVK